jgi:hypothetical protein
MVPGLKPTTFRLELTEDGAQRGVIELPARGSFVVGRHGSCELVVHGSGVSRRHALISVAGNELAVQDLASKNGTYVNGQESQVEVLLSHGDTIRIGRSVLIRVIASAEPLAAKKLEAAAPIAVERVAAPVESGGPSCEACDAKIPALNVRSGALPFDDGAWLCPACAKALPGRDLIAGRYRVLAKIGEGGVATVLKAIDERVRRIVAVKKMKAKVPELAVAYLAQEIEILRSLDHPGIVRLLDAGEHGGDRFLVMELVHGADLESLIASHERLGAPDAAQVGFAVASALALAHERGVVHRDVKPSNVLVDRAGTVKLVDFGVARLGKPGKQRVSDRLTVRGSRRGTPAYMAPEQALDPANAGPPADVYGVGATLYHALSGAPPYGLRTTPAQILEKLDRGEPPAAPEIPGKSPADVGLTAIVRRALEHDPAKRFPDAGALRAALSEVIDGPRRLGTLLRR